MSLCIIYQVNKQNKAQLKRLQTMRGFLDEYKEKHDSFEGWMEDAKEKLQTAGNIVSDLEHLQQHAEALEVSSSKSVDRQH